MRPEKFPQCRAKYAKNRNQEKERNYGTTPLMQELSNTLIIEWSKVKKEKSYQQILHKEELKTQVCHTNVWLCIQTQR